MPDQSSSEAQLQQLYAQRKQATSAPASSKHKVMRQARQHAREQGSKQRHLLVHINWFNWLSGISATAATCLLFMLLVNQPLFEQPQVVVQVEYHDLQNLAAAKPSLAKQLRVKYDQQYQHLLVQQQRTALHHSRGAQLLQSEKGWQLITCDQQKMHISQQLLAALGKANRLPAEVTNGQWVTIDFDKQGRIIGIQTTTEVC